MLVAMAITLLMMAAVVTLFANIGNSVRERRAVIEMSGQLRQARQLLARDLSGATCRAITGQGTTGQEPEENQGYLEILEGAWSDTEPGALVNGILADGELNYSLSTVPSSQMVQNGMVDRDQDGNADDLYLDGDPNNSNNADRDVVTDGWALGDYDDILALTVRSVGEPFVGRGPNGQIIQSQLAEVVWYAVENPQTDPTYNTSYDPNSPQLTGLGEPGMRRIYRRVNLIAPWVVIPDADKQLAPQWFFRKYNLSVRWDATDPNDASTVQWIANDLGDLTKRENRFAHQPNWQLDNNGNWVYTNNYPNLMDVSAIRLDPANLDNSTINRFPTNSVRDPRRRSPLHPYGLPFEYDETDTIDFDVTDVAEEPRTPPHRIDPVSNVRVLDDRTGEDLVLDNALGFDIRVYDPGAPLLYNGGAIVQPFDRGWIELANASARKGENLVPVSFGAYVDMFWMRRWWGTNEQPTWATPQGTPLALFAGPTSDPLDRSGLNLLNTSYAYPSVSYDTWSSHYEHDGIDTDDSTNNSGPVDEGFNGLDDDNANGVDDPGERETSPPYDVSLLGIEVRMRVYEQDARQVRETSIIHSFPR
jgi:hypothetical protein